MGPDIFRKRLGFAVCCSAPLALLTAVPAQAAAFNLASAGNTIPIAIAFGAGAFGLLAMNAMRRSRREQLELQKRSGEQIAAMRAAADEYEALLSAAPELTVMWSEGRANARIWGQVGAIIPLARRADAALNFDAWLVPEHAGSLQDNLHALRTEGRSFTLTLKTRDNRRIRAAGWALGNGHVLRLRPAADPIPAPQPTAMLPFAEARAVLEQLTFPAYLRDVTGRVMFANAAHLTLAAKLGRSDAPEAPADLVGSPKNADDVQRRRRLDLGRSGLFDAVEFALPTGSAGVLVPIAAVQPVTQTATLGNIIDVLTVPIAVFNAERELVRANRAYANLWHLDPVWLHSGLDEPGILDRLRTDGLLPNEPNYREWRTKHLKTYELTAPTELSPWHLPDGRTIKVIAAPAGPQGGVIYIFEDITARLDLESRNKALASVQRETLNALSEAVAVFGTNGRLTLSNPRLSALWKLPLNELGKSPHIDGIIAAADRTLPADGADIWRDLKRRVIDLNPTRPDSAGRITRSDGRLLDYAVTKLPDGQTMITFLDVTESAQYSSMLKERNDALVAADKLKDAFVQNVSYELRSPLTNIIGFADLLASDTFGTLNGRQRAYTDYIRASSVTLGVLIDNILDLATVDAGIAELRPELQDVRALIEKARAGIAATFPQVDGETPLNLSVDIPDTLPAFVADGTRIVQVLYNLLSNAVRFSEPGGAIQLSVQSRADRMLFVIEDEGPGINEELRAALLDRMDVPAGRQRGAGLGLTIVKTFVNLHGGTISVDQREPRGTRVVVNLPRDVTAIATSGSA